MVPLLERLLLVPIDPAVPLAPRRRKPPELIAIDDPEEKVVFPSTRRVPPELMVTFPASLPVKERLPEAIFAALPVAVADALITT